MENRFDPNRSEAKRNIIPKFIIVSEGYRTEPKYFSALNDNRVIAGISVLIDIVVLQRESIDAGVSSPTSLLTLLDEYMESVRRGSYTLDLMVDSIAGASGLTCLDDIERLRRSVFKESSSFVDEMGFVKDEYGMVDVCCKCYHEIFNADPVINLPRLVDYRQGIDRICVVVDRDRDNRSSSDIDEFIRRCNRSGYEPYITNPCFELWLLMHFEEFYRLDRDSLLKNPMIGGKRWTECELDRIVRDINPENKFDKVDYDPLIFMHRTHHAIETSFILCHDVLRLKSEVGTNLGSLLKDMQKEA